jgi:hypothetical protein
VKFGEWGDGVRRREVRYADRVLSDADILDEPLEHQWALLRRKIRLVKFEDVNLLNLAEEDLLLGVEACSVSVLIRGRNAWRSTWVRHWFHNSHLFSDHRSAQLGAEPLRAPGNVFYVYDVPALLLIGSAARLVLIDGIRGEPFKHFEGFKEESVNSAYGSYIKGVFPGITMHQAMVAFDERSEWWRSPAGINSRVRFGVVPDDGYVTKLPRGRFKSSTSYPQGSGYYLGWRANDLSLPKAGAREQARAWRELLNDVAGEDRPAPGEALWSTGESRRSLAQILQKHHAKRLDSVGSADSIRANYHKALDEAELLVHAAERKLDDLREAEDLVQAEVWDAESFAEDP